MWQNAPVLPCARSERSRQASMRFLLPKSVLAACAAAASLAASATDVTLIGLFPGKALVSIDKGPPRTLSVGEKTPEGVSLLATTRSSADVDIDGKRQTLEMGQAYRSEGPGRQKV